MCYVGIILKYSYIKDLKTHTASHIVTIDPHRVYVGIPPFLSKGVVVIECDYSEYGYESKMRKRPENIYYYYPIDVDPESYGSWFGSNRVFLRTDGTLFFDEILLRSMVITYLGEDLSTLRDNDISHIYCTCATGVDFPSSDGKKLVSEADAENIRGLFPFLFFEVWKTEMEAINEMKRLLYFLPNGRVSKLSLDSPTYHNPQLFLSFQKSLKRYSEKYENLHFPECIRDGDFVLEDKDIIPLQKGKRRLGTNFSVSDGAESGVIFYEDGLYISLLFGQTVWEGSDIDYNLEGII